MTLRFVFLRHELPTAAERASHFDLLFEVEGAPESEALRSWAVERLPDPAGGVVAAIELPPHRRDYLDYEGPVSGGRGSVRRIDQGVIERCHDSGDQVMYDLAGERFRGRLRCQRPPVHHAESPLGSGADQGWGIAWLPAEASR